MKFYMAVVAVIFSGPVYAVDFPVNDQDQQAILHICTSAASDQKLSLDDRMAFTNWCMNWKNRVQAASQPQPTTPPKPN